ncbi:MAG TPA: hypothetical protein VGE66_11145 [Chitinophagaceae bacterium]
MKLLLLLPGLIMWATGLGHADLRDKDKPNGNNIFIITLDGFRWQELFFGADSTLIHDPSHTADTTFAKAMFWDPAMERRREKLMPFVWNIIARNGQLIGNRHKGSRVNTKNFYSVSYPGYNEIFTGAADPLVADNVKKKNRNVNLLEYLNRLPQYSGKIAAFTSWNLFPYILNEERSKVYVNSGYEPDEKGELTRTQQALNKIMLHPDHKEEPERNDLLTFLAAREYILKHQPKVMYIGLGGTDTYGHNRKYGQYLKEANSADRIIADLWNLVQTTPFYKDRTTFIITTDHGRGNSASSWHRHGAFVAGSSQTWIALLGRSVKPLGEVSGGDQLFQKHVAGTVGFLLGVRSFSNRMLPVTSFEVEQ